MNLWPKQTPEENRLKQRLLKKNRPEYILWQGAKRRAQIKDLVFDIVPEDIEIPEVCPYLKVPMIANTRTAPSLDRIDNRLGYVKDNIEVISVKANAMKNDASIQELLEFAYEILERY